MLDSCRVAYVRASRLRNFPGEGRPSEAAIQLHPNLHKSKFFEPSRFFAACKLPSRSRSRIFKARLTCSHCRSLAHRIL